MSGLLIEIRNRGEISMEKTIDLVAIGRAALDLNSIEINRPMEETESFRKYVGGSPANIAIGQAKLGQKVKFIGKVGDEHHGRFIVQYMKDAGVDMSDVVVDNESHMTGLTFTEIKSPSESNIIQYRDEVADLFIRPDEVKEETIANAKTLLVSGTALAQSPSREAVLYAIDLAHQHDTRVIFEIDYRPYTWKSAEETSIYYTLVAQLSDVVIGTRDEFNMLENSDEADNKKTVEKLFNYRPELIVIKHGVQGSHSYTKDGKVYDGKAYKANVVKTFGAGDSYAAAFIYALNKGKGVHDALKYGAASAAIVVSRHSSSEAMPTVDEIEALIIEQDGSL